MGTKIKGGIDDGPRAASKAAAVSVARHPRATHFCRKSQRRPAHLVASGAPDRSVTTVHIEPQRVPATWCHVRRARRVRHIRRPFGRGALEASMKTRIFVIDDEPDFTHM